MQIVIDIPGRIQYGIENGITVNGSVASQIVLDAVKNGIPLPKGHGRLIDADALKLTQHDIHVESINYRHRCISVENVDEAPTIIEADKEADECGD